MLCMWLTGKQKAHAHKRWRLVSLGVPGKKVLSLVVFFDAVGSDPEVRCFRVGDCKIGEHTSEWATGGARQQDAQLGGVVQAVGSDLKLRFCGSSGAHERTPANCVRRLPALR